MYTEVIPLKKTEPITFRTNSAVKAALNIIATEKKWSISQLSEEIIKEWLSIHRPELLQEEE